jgi:16S rRNA (cytosine1402-N4)-methyltransferase
MVEILTRKPVVPTDREIEENPRARSAKLRACLKLN